jgi:hypothetical protein
LLAKLVGLPNGNLARSLEMAEKDLNSSAIASHRMSAQILSEGRGLMGIDANLQGPPSSFNV